MIFVRDFERREANEALYGDLVARAVAAADDFGRSGGWLEVLCECADERCSERIAIRSEAYARVRAEPGQFIVMPGHQRPGVDWVRRAEGRCVVVERAVDPLAAR